MKNVNRLKRKRDNEKRNELKEMLNLRRKRNKKKRKKNLRRKLTHF